MLWNIIRDFFVQFIFGGIDSNQVVYGGIFGLIATGDDNINTFQTNEFYVGLNNTYDEIDSYFGTHYINVGDWLSTTATIITMVGFCIFLYLIIRWFFRIGSSLISYR